MYLITDRSNTNYSALRLIFLRPGFLASPQTFIWATLTATGNSSTIFSSSFCEKNHFWDLSGLTLQRESVVFNMYVLNCKQESCTRTQRRLKKEPQERNRNVKNASSVKRSQGLPTSDSFSIGEIHTL